MFIRTERLFLRPVFPEDWGAVLAGIAEESTVGMLATAPWPYGEADARAFCERVDDPNWPRFAITLPSEGGAFVGTIGIHPEPEGAEIGYWIARAWQRNGIAPEALCGVLEVAAMLGLPRVHAGHFVDNAASGKVLARCGFVPTGEVRPMASAARGGELVLARRFVRELRGTARCNRAIGAPVAA
jgi:RimJ/RimL family protein N-acetyltransferase